MKELATVPATRQGGGYSPAGLAPHYYYEAGTMKLKALQQLRYNRKPVKVGEVFEAGPGDVRILVAIGKAEAYVEPVKQVIKPVPPAVVERVESMIANGSITEQQAEQVLEQHATAPKRQYRRRDMTSEE